MTKTMQAIVAIIYDAGKSKISGTTFSGKDEFLILKKKGTWIGWQFVQGEKEKGEKWEDAVKREVKEETGLSDIKVVKKLDIKNDYWFNWKGEKIHKFLTYFLVEANKKDKIKLSVEHSDYKWCKYKEALESIKYNKEEFKKAVKGK